MSSGRTTVTHSTRWPQHFERSVAVVEWMGGGATQRRAIDAPTIVGSAAQVDIRLEDPTVSALHVELSPTKTGVVVRDLGSRNGTIVNGLRVRDALVPPGVSLQLGARSVHLHAAAQPKVVELWSEERFGGLVGSSGAMRELFLRLSQIASSDATVLLRGETGTGKELVARSIHDASSRRGAPYVIVDCASLPENLLEAELYGHAAGAFTGAQASRAGAFEQAEGGTVFLDEIGELPLAQQPKLLRVLEARTVRRLGENQERRVNARFVAATHRDLREMVNAGAFREDLYFRLAVVPLRVPALRERLEDLPLLVHHFAPPDRRGAIDIVTLQRMRDLPWYGNVRELKNFVERLVLLGPREAFGDTDAHAPLPEPRRPPRAGGAHASFELPMVPCDVPFKELREAWVSHLEREYVAELLRQKGRNVTAVADAAGLDRGYIYRLMKKHDL